MNKTNLLITTCLLLIAGMQAMGQTQSPELKAFQEAAGNSSILFRGKQANFYERQANGNPYWSAKAFTPATVVFEGNRYDDILVNIDAVDGKVLVRTADNPIAVALIPEAVNSIRTENALYECFGEGEALPYGIYEVFGEGPVKVYKHVSKRILVSTRDMNGDPIGYYDPDYNYDINSYYAITKTYYFMDAEGQVSRIRGKRALIGKFPERRKELRKALSQARLDTPGTDFDTFCKGLLGIVSR